jgi:hypothetical protein
MANMNESNRWANPVGFFEYESSHHDAYDDDDWLTSNFASDYVAKDQYTEAEDALMDLVVTNVQITTDPQINILKLVSRKNKKISFGVSTDVIMLKCLVFDDSSKKAEEKINDIREFINRHDKMSNNDIYMIIRRKVSDTWYYIEWEDDSENYDRKYLQCSLQMGKPKLKNYGVWELNLQVEESNA